MVIKSLPPSFTVEEITDDFKKQNINVIKITQITKNITTDNVEEIRKLLMYIAIISKDAPLKSIFQVKILCYCLVAWEKLKPSNCFRKPVCGNCAENHETKSCGNINIQPTCHKCKKRYKANDKNCE